MAEKNEFDKKARETETKVLRNYRVHSPSKLPYEDPTYRTIHAERRLRLFRDRLKLPPQLFRGAIVLDLGCGTGEQDLLYAEWGACLILVDGNEISTAQAARYFQQFGREEQLFSIQTKSIFDFETEEKVDIAICEGVLHHTDDPGGGFDRLVKSLVPGGFVVLQLAFDSAFFQRALHRLILDVLTDGQQNEVEKVAKILFKDTLERARRFGGRSIDQIVYDFYTNPKHKGIDVREIFNWFQKHGIQYYSSYPMIEIEGLINGIHKPAAGELIIANPFITAFASLMFLIASEDDEDSVSFFRPEGEDTLEKFDTLMRVSGLRDYEYGLKTNLRDLSSGFEEYVEAVSALYLARSSVLQNKLTKLRTEFSTLINALDSKDEMLVESVIDGFQHLFRGYNGVPSNYIVGYRTG